MTDDTDPPLRQMYDPAAETALLAACLLSKNARIAAKRMMTPRDLYNPVHERLFAAMLALDRAGRNVDAVTVRAAVAGDSHPAAMEAALLAVATDTFAMPDSVRDYAAIVRRWSLKRTLAEAGRHITQQALSPTVSPDTLASEAVTRLAAIRDHGLGDIAALTLGELLDTTDDGPRWVIPGLLEAGDRLILTGLEGAGKSVLARQLVIMTSAGLHPFLGSMVPPIKGMIVDCENKGGQVRRAARPLVSWIQETTGHTDPLDRVLIDTPGRLDITSDRGLARLHQAIDAWQPDLVVMGPIYKMARRGLNKDEEADAYLAAVDTLTERGIAVILEAHAGHAQQDAGGRKTERALRPRGSSVLMGWPEFGLGLRALGGGIADLEPWRGGREARNWPSRLKRATGNRWVETHPEHRPEPPEDPPEQPPLTDDGW